MSAKPDRSKPIGQQEPGDTTMAPGDEAPPGTPGAGEDICPACNGSGRIDGRRCDTCEGIGRVIRGIGGA